MRSAPTCCAAQASRSSGRNLRCWRCALACVLSWRYGCSGGGDGGSVTMRSHEHRDRGQMTFAAGGTFGPYRIDTALGSGGMGEVFRARDTRLGRDVAVKVLPSRVAGDSERLARFRREARLLAALNHPHIAAIYELEEVDGICALILELVEGP